MPEEANDGEVKTVDKIKQEKLEAQKRAVDEINRIVAENDLEVRIEHSIRFVAR